MLLGKLTASLLGSALTGKRNNNSRWRSNKSRLKYLMPPHPLSLKYKIIIKINLNLMEFIQEIIYLKKDGAYIINLYEYKSIRTHWIALYVNAKKVIYFDILELNIFQKKL